MRYILLYTDEENNWIAEVPSLPGCGSEGKTREEALENVREAIEVYIEALEQDHREVPDEFINPELVALELVH
jgi:predicted RNase H-like HicB family nuclease